MLTVLIILKAFMLISSQLQVCFGFLHTPLSLSIHCCGGNYSALQRASISSFELCFLSWPPDLNFLQSLCSNTGSLIFTLHFTPDKYKIIIFAPNYLLTSLLRCSPSHTTPFHHHTRSTLSLIKVTSHSRCYHPPPLQLTIQLNIFYKCCLKTPSCSMPPSLCYPNPPHPLVSSSCKSSYSPSFPNS